MKFPSKLIIISTLLIAFSLRAMAQRDSTAAVHLGFIYPISSHGKHAPDYTNRFSLHILAGVSKAETGASIASVANIVKQQASGAQIAGVANVIGGAASGTQVAGAVNVIGGDARGAQIAGVANVTGGMAKGVQIAGLLNRGNEVNAQIAGFANIAKKVKGVQLAGLINIADSSDYPIAIFNFIKNGEKSISVSIDETMTGMVSFRSGGRVLYGIAGIGYNFKDNPKAMFAAEGGLGAHIPLAGSLRMNLEAVSQTISDFDGRTFNKNSLRILPALKFGNRFEVFAGPTVNYVSYGREDNFDYIKKFIWKNDTSRDFQGLFVGFNAGLQLVF